MISSSEITCFPESTITNLLEIFAFKETTFAIRALATVKSKGKSLTSAFTYGTDKFK